MNKEELKSLLEHYDNLYYNQDTSEISDFQYDALKDSYVKDHGEYTYVPGKALSNKFKHTTPILSLDKVQITDEVRLRTELARLWPVVIQPKMDGLTSVYYPNVEKFTTRGNGFVGEDVTEAMKHVMGIGHTVGITNPVRSEVVMLISQFKIVNKQRVKEGLEPFKNPRNAAAGMLRSKDTSKVKGLFNFAYNIITPGIEDNDASAQLKKLSQAYYWNTVLSYTPSNIEDAMTYIKAFDRTTLDYEIDGLVIKHNGAKQFGATGHHPKNAIAVKFVAEAVWTTIKRVVWKAGRTGKLTPIAEFDTVGLLGADVSRATLHNYSIMKAIGLTHILLEGKYTPITRVKVIKANDVIPAIVEVQQPDVIASNLYERMLYEPTCCPECKGEVFKVKDQLFCNNERCPSKVVGALTHLAKRDAFDIEGLSEETAIKLVEYYKNELETILNQMGIAEESGEDVSEIYLETEVLLKNIHPSFIFKLGYTDLFELDGFAEKSAQKLYNNIQASKNIDFNKFLYGCGMPLIGRSISKDIAEYYSFKSPHAHIAMTDDYYLDFAGLKSIDGIGDETINSLKNNWQSHVVPFGDVLGLNINNIEIPKKVTNQLNFVITGKFDISRGDIKDIIEKAGHKVSGSVSTKTNYLIASLGEESTAKYKKAIELDITIINSVKDLEGVVNG